MTRSRHQHLLGERQPVLATLEQPHVPAHFVDQQSAGQVVPGVEVPVAADEIDLADGENGVVDGATAPARGGRPSRTDNAELLLADDVSSASDAKTEIELWQALRQRSATVVGATSKRAALARADRVVVMVDGEVAAVGPWDNLSADWGHLAG